MTPASQLKKNMAIEVHGQAHVVHAIHVQTPSARGAATLYKIRARNVVTGRKADLSCRGEEAFREMDFVKKEAQFLYRDQDTFCFMDLEDYSQFELHAAMLEEELPYLIDDLEVTALVIDGVVRAIELPDTVSLRIDVCSPGIKGASATARGKAATLQTGLVVTVPEYLESGEVITVDTRDGRYLSRA